jgi:hypothetical protein
MSQLDLPFPAPPPQNYLPDPQKVRNRLHRILDQMRAGRLPNNLPMWRIVFPNMCNWLPTEEAAQLREEFVREAELLAELNKG